MFVLLSLRGRDVRTPLAPREGSRHAERDEYVSQERKNPEAAVNLRVSFLAVLSAERIRNPKASS
jgi:hypothetical protein